MAKYLLLFILTSCASKMIKYDYIVQTPQGSFLCDEMVESPYGAAAKNCLSYKDLSEVETIPNPYSYTRVKE